MRSGPAVGSGAGAEEGAADGAPASTRAGHVALAGLPNAGKSTLVNALVGERLSIVTPKAQTTWQRVAAIRSEADVQMVFVDTPGLVFGPRLFHRSMLAEAEAARRDADVVLGIVDGAARTDESEGALADHLARARCPVAVVSNKSDRRDHSPARAEEMARGLGAPVFPVSAKRGDGLERLLDFLRASLPVGPFLYPPDDVAAAPVRFFVRELIRETVFERYRQEVPYAVAVTVDEFRERSDPLYIAATLHVEGKSQKGIVIGKGGAAIKALGRESRAKVERLLERSVYLDLWVKVWEGWRSKPKGLRTFGYGAPSDGT